MGRNIIRTAALMGMTAIILGAFGAHALKKILEPEAVATFETGVRYQMYHVFFLLFIGRSRSLSATAKKWIYYLTVTGIVLFSGSIYLLALEPITNFNIKAIGIITPIGGLLLIVAWFWLFIDFTRNKS